MQTVALFEGKQGLFAVCDDRAYLELEQRNSTWSDDALAILQGNTADWRTEIRSVSILPDDEVLTMLQEPGTRYISDYDGFTFCFNDQVVPGTTALSYLHSALLAAAHLRINDTEELQAYREELMAMRDKEDEWLHWVVTADAADILQELQHA